MEQNRKSIIVTGASGGMGRAVCSLLSKEYNVFALDVNACEEMDGVTNIPCDVTNEQSVITAFNQVRHQTNELFAIIHTAGIYDLDSLLEMTEERFIKIFNVNLFGIYRINKTFFPLLKEGSRIVIVSSELAPLDPLPFTGVYAISKSAVEKYAHSLRAEVNLKGICVSIIRPGAVKTNMLGTSTTALDKFCKQTSLYPVNAKRFKRIVDSVENKCVPAEKIAKKVEKAINSKKPKYVYNINRNFLLRLLSSLPKRLQVWILKLILK